MGMSFIMAKPMGSLINKLLLLFGVIFSLSKWGSSASALAAGIFIAVAFGNTLTGLTSKLSKKLLVYSIVGLGASMNLSVVAASGIQGLGFTVITILLTIVFGLVLGKILKINSEVSSLISVGTAICGGSAIAALAPAIKAKPESTSIALGIVFLLNSVGLLVFPYFGHLLNFSQQQFGLWAALAIHDTSSVVGAGLQYGSEALQVATTIKLARAIWIVPVVFIFSHFYSRQKHEDQAHVQKPWFILGFLVVAAIFTWIPQLQQFSQMINFISRKGLVLALFFIGTNLSLDSIKSVGLRPLLHAFLLWFAVATTSSLIIYNL